MVAPVPAGQSQRIGVQPEKEARRFRMDVGIGILRLLAKAHHRTVQLLFRDRGGQRHQHAFVFFGDHAARLAQLLHRLGDLALADAFGLAVQLLDGGHHRTFLHPKQEGIHFVVDHRAYLFRLQFALLLVLVDDGAQVVERIAVDPVDV